MDPLVVGNAAGFWGDWSLAPRRLVADPRLEVLTLEYLAELTMSILARQRQKAPRRGYVGDFPPLVQELAPWLAGSERRRIVTNAGGVNPQACVQEAARRLVAAGHGELPLGVVWGDDLLPHLDTLRSRGWQAPHFDTGEPFPFQEHTVVCANAYLGAEPIVQCLARGACVVVTGRVADASLTVGPARWHFGWKADSWDLLAAAAVAGHVIECGAQATGGYSEFWQQLDLAEVGYPLAELSADGTVVITKPTGTGGAVNRHTVSEQLLYEVGDPSAYHTPDVTVDFTAVELEEAGRDRVRLRGARGSPPPQDYKVSLAYQAGWFTSSYLVVYGPQAVEKAHYCASLLRRRLELAGALPREFHYEVLGTGAAVPGRQQPLPDQREVVLRVAASDPRREVVEQAARLVPSLATSGPSGLAGYTEARGQVRPVFAYWPTRIACSLVQPQWEVRSAAQWLS